jgi:hypothetical protein
VIYGQIGRISRKLGIRWDEILFTPVHAFTVKDEGGLKKAESICGKVRADSSVGKTWIINMNYYVRTGIRLDFELKPCYYCKKRHKDALVAEVMLTEGDKA